MWASEWAPMSFYAGMIFEELLFRIKLYSMKSISFFLISFGFVFILAGAVFYFADKVPWFGRLPGDIKVKGENYSFYFPVATCIVISIALTLLGNFILRFFSK